MKTVKLLLMCTMVSIFIGLTSAMAMEIKDFIPEQISLSGAIEIEAAFEDNDADDEDSSDVSLATAELGIDIELEKWAKGFALISWDDEDEKVIFEEAFITLGATDNIPYYLQAGKFYMPFGSFETNMVSDPFTQDMGEILDEGALAGIAISGFSGSVYLFNGESDEVEEDDTLACFGASMGYVMETDNFALTMGADWINNLLESGTLRDMVADNGELKDYVAGYAFHAILNAGPFAVMGEYIGANDDIEFTSGDSFEAPSVWMVEAAYTFEVFSKETTFALGYQATDDAVGILPESKIMGAVGISLTDSLAFNTEYAVADDYDISDGGTGDDITSITLQLALEF